jgi:uncharacterized delta-60 repeat protein
LDPSFGIGGVVDTSSGAPPPGAVAYGIAIQSDGKIVAAGSSNQKVLGFSLLYAAPSIARYNADGSLDTSFGTGEIVSYAPSGPGYFTALALQADGRILAAGNDFGEDGCFIRRFVSDGKEDTTFGEGGAGVVHLGPNRWCNALALQPNGGIVVGGHAVITVAGSQVSRYWLQRLNTYGSRDSKFGDGATEILLPSDPNVLPVFYALAVDASGTIVASGKREILPPGTASEMVLARFDSGGRIDTTFGSGGIVAISTGTDSYAVSSAVVLQLDGKIVTAGSSESRRPTSADPPLLTLARVLPNGALDTSFGASGIVTSNLGAVYAEATAVALQRNGKLVIVGALGDSLDYATRRVLIVRYESDGTIDRGFGANGHAETLATGQAARAVAIREDGRLNVAGTSSSDFSSQNYWIGTYFGDPVAPGAQ